MQKVVLYHYSPRVTKCTDQSKEPLWKTPLLCSKEQGIPLCNWDPTNSRNCHWRIILWSEATHHWSSVSTKHSSISGRRCLQMCPIWFMKKNHVSQYRKKAYISSGQRGLKQRERKSHLSSAVSKFSWCWIMFQNSFSIPWVSQTAWKQLRKTSKGEREFLTAPVHPLLLDTEDCTHDKHSGLWSSTSKQMCASGDRPAFKSIIANACPLQCLIQSSFPAWQGRIKWKHAKYTNIKPLNSEHTIKINGNRDQFQIKQQQRKNLKKQTPSPHTLKTFLSWFSMLPEYIYGYVTKEKSKMPLVNGVLKNW